MDGTDTTLAAAWQGGDERAGEELITRYYPAIVRFFQTKIDAEAQDLVQATFLRAAEAKQRFEGRSSFRAFVFGIARNVLLERFRAKARELKNFNLDFAVSSIVDLNPGVSTAAWKRREQRVMIEALQELPLELQMTLEMTYWENMTAPELAAVFEIPAGTVKSRLFRARKLLREKMEALVLPTHDDESVRELASRWLDGLRDQEL